MNDKSQKLIYELREALGELQAEIERLQCVCTLSHEELLGSASDREILEIPESGWNPNAARGSE